MTFSRHGTGDKRRRLQDANHALPNSRKFTFRAKAHIACMISQISAAMFSMNVRIDEPSVAILENKARLANYSAVL